MKKLNLLFLGSLTVIISCDSGNSKQILSSDNNSENPEDVIAIENNKIMERNENINDTILFSNEIFNTPYIKDVKSYFRQNNHYKDWAKEDKKEVVINYSTLKDGTNINVRVRKSSGIQKLDNEAILLIQNMKYDEPAIDFEYNPINVENMAILVYFPPQ